ncbi:MAG: DsrE family protein [Proteobacteria bacterium]|nr:DsrE family protein [Pseudomonadota bacterium]
MIKTITLILALLFSAGAALAEDSGKYGKQKVVYHINHDNPKQQAGALRNIQNHINAVGAENLELRVVLHGNGLSLLLPPEEVEGTKMKVGNATEELQAKIDTLKSQGVGFDVCNNTLNGRKIAYEDLHDVSHGDIVPSGVAELAHLQSQGFTYIRP